MPTALITLLATIAENIIPRVVDTLFSRLNTSHGAAPLKPLTRPTPKLSATAAILTLCQRYHCSVTSWYRTPAHNAAVGGVPNSAHLNGRAWDLLPDSPTDLSRVETAAKSLGLKALNHKGHVHIQTGEIPSANS